MVQARISSAKVIERKLQPQSFEFQQYCQLGVRILHQEGFRQLKLQKTRIQTGFRQDDADAL